MTDREEMELLVLKAELKNYKRWYFDCVEKLEQIKRERDAAMKEVDQAYVDILAPLEKAHVAKPDDPTTVELLKSVYFRLRDTSPAMMENFKKYDELFKSMPQQ